jgi:putative effector of murein hydrolase
MFHWMIKTPSKYQVYMLYAVPLMISSRFILHLLLFFDIQYRKAADGDVSEIIV